MVHKIIIDIHRSAVRLTCFDCLGAPSGNSCLDLGQTLVSIAQFCAVTLMGSHIDNLMEPRQAAITKKTHGKFKIFMK
jgi:hypothetical protein